MRRGKRETVSGRATERSRRDGVRVVRMERIFDSYSKFILNIETVSRYSIRLRIQKVSAI